MADLGRLAGQFAPPRHGYLWQSCARALKLGGAGKSWVRLDRGPIMISARDVKFGPQTQFTRRNSAAGLRDLCDRLEPQKILAGWTCRRPENGPHNRLNPPRQGLPCPK